MADDFGRVLRDINDAPWLQEPHVHIHDQEKVIEKVNSIIQGGKDKLQVIFDFDRTITKHHVDGVIVDSSFGILEKMPELPEDFKKKSQTSLEKYRPIETNPNLTIEEKLPIMVQWWTEGLELLKSIPWDSLAMDEYLKQHKIPLRDGTSEVFSALQAASVPVLVFSAGIGDVVSANLKHHRLITNNVHVISNFLKIEDEKILGYQGDIIHVFNKNEHLIEDTPYFTELSGRTNVLLLGDSTGDATMADGVPHDTVLKIGFLNSNIEASLPLYKQLFDIVLTDDQSMNVLLNILKLTL